MPSLRLPAERLPASTAATSVNIASRRSITLRSAEGFLPNFTSIRSIWKGLRFSPLSGRPSMSNTRYPRDRTAYLLVDPYNDFLSEGGKVNALLKPVADEVGLLDNLRKLDAAVR